MVAKTVVCWRWYGFLFTSSFSLFSFCIISLFYLLLFPLYYFLSQNIFIFNLKLSFFPIFFILILSFFFSFSFIISFAFWFNLPLLLPTQTLVFFSHFILAFSLSSLALLTSCFVHLFIDNEEALGTFLGRMIVAIGSLG